MAISNTLKNYLAQQGIAYDVVPHRRCITTMNAVKSAHLAAEMVAKPVILEDDAGYLMAVVPANHHVKFGKLNKSLGRKMGLATESELQQLFFDCEIGAIPPVGQAFGIDTVVDDSLADCSDIYMEAGDHEEFLHINGSAYRKMMHSAQHARIC